MNQILSSNETIDQNFSDTKYPKKRKSNFFKFQFILCLFFVITITSYYFYLQYDKKQKEILSEEIIDHYSITNLYSNNNSSYSASYLSNENIFQTDSFNFSVIGLIEINSIGINYPIINEFNYDLLKIAPCKFLGPNPNQIRQPLYCRT